jgi:hypothetical protein
MRLKEYEIEAIKEAVNKFDKDAQVYYLVQELIILKGAAI